MKYLPILLLLLSACSSPQKMIQQTWEIADVQFLDSINTLPAQQKEMLTKSLKTQIQFSFLPDSAYQVRSKDEVINGQWWLSSDKKTLYTSNKEGIIVSKIHELKKSVFKFESPGQMNQSFLFTCSPVPTSKK